MKITKEQFKNIVREVMTEESEYQKFFAKALEKTGKSIPDMSDEEKKAFFNKIDAAWDGKGEKNEGNAFGAAVQQAKKDGEDEFEVGGEKFKVEEDFKAVVGKTIFSDGKGKLFFGYYKEDDSVHFVDYNTWKKLSMKDVSKGNTNKERVIKAILKGQKQFNKKVDFNMWAKKNNPSFEQTMDWFIQNGWISNINKGGIKESLVSVNEEKYTVIDPRGNSLGTAEKNQVVMAAKKKGGEKTGHFVVSAKNALKARRALEKFKGDFKNPKLKDMMVSLYESVKK